MIKPKFRFKTPQHKYRRKVVVLYQEKPNSKTGCLVTMTNRCSKNTSYSMSWGKIAVNKLRKYFSKEIKSPRLFKIALSRIP